MAVQQLPGILDGFGDSVPFTEEAWGDGGEGSSRASERGRVLPPLG